MLNAADENYSHFLLPVERECDTMFVELDDQAPGYQGGSIVATQSPALGKSHCFCPTARLVRSNDDRQQRQVQAKWVLWARPHFAFASSLAPRPRFEVSCRRDSATSSTESMPTPPTKSPNPPPKQPQYWMNAWTALHSLVWLQTRESGWSLLLGGMLMSYGREVGFFSFSRSLLLPHAVARDR